MIKTMGSGACLVSMEMVETLETMFGEKSRNRRSRGEPFGPAYLGSSAGAIKKFSPYTISIVSIISA